MSSKTPEEKKAAQAAYAKAYYERNKERVVARNKAYLAANKERAAARRKAYYEENRERDRAYREANKESIAAQKKAYREANKEATAAQKKAYREANKAAIAAQKKAYREANKADLCAKDKVYRETHREAIRAQQKVYAEEARPSYVRGVLKLPKDTPQDLIDLHTGHILIRRALRQLNTEIAATGLPDLSQVTAEFLPTKTAAAYLHIHEVTLHSWAARGVAHCSPVKVNGRSWWKVSDIKAVLAAREAKQKGV